jgi:hypothetical protein
MKTFDNLVVCHENNLERSPACSVLTQTTISSSAIPMRMDEFDSLCESWLDGESHQLHISPLVRRMLERQKRDHQIQVQKRRNMSSIVVADKGELHDSDVMIPIKHHRRVRIADTLLFIKEGYIIYEEDLSESVRALLCDEPSDDDGTNNRPHKPKWYPSRKWWAGVAFTAVVAVAAAVMTGRRRRY